MEYGPYHPRNLGPPPTFEEYRRKLEEEKLPLCECGGRIHTIFGEPVCNKCDGRTQLDVMVEKHGKP